MTEEKPGSQQSAEASDDEPTEPERGADEPSSTPPPESSGETRWYPI